MSSPIITLLTDFGLSDNYVGVMKGVILALCPQAQLVDLSHGIPPQDIAAGAFLLERSTHWFPERSVHLAVVDPGVGSGRRGLAVWAGGRYFVAPDNGLLTHVLDGHPKARLFAIENEGWMLPRRSCTFHGRDVFSPVAARLALGLSLEDVGLPIDDPVRLPLPPLQRQANAVEGSVVYVDHFGNLVSNIPGGDVEKLGPARVVLQGRTLIPVQSHYEAVEVGEPLAVVGGFDRLEISVRNGSAAEALGADLGVGVRVESL